MQCSRSAVAVQSQCSRSAVAVQSQCSRSAVAVQSQCSRSAVAVQSQCSRSAVAVPSLRGGAKEAVPPLTTACAPPVRFTQNTFSEHHVTARQQAIIEKGIITFKHNSRLKFSPFFAKLLATNCCTLGWSLFQNFGKLYENRVKFVRFR